MLLANDREKVTIEALDFTVDATEIPRTATIERVWIDELRPRAGRTVPLKVLTRSYRGEETISTVDLAIPPNATGSLSVPSSSGRCAGPFSHRAWRR
jgi:hypothetical protein